MKLPWSVDQSGNVHHSPASGTEAARKKIAGSLDVEVWDDTMKAGLLDKEYDAWFSELSAAAGFQVAVHRQTASQAGSSRRCRAGPPITCLASWRSQKAGALISRRVPGASIGTPQRGRTHHPSKEIM